MKTRISVETTINAPAAKVWNFLTTPEDIRKWNNASDDWHTPRAENDLRVGGKFLYRMEARDGSAGFDFEGVYREITTHQLIAYNLGDGRDVTIILKSDGNGTTVVETFEAESLYSLELQRSGWQAILDNLKKYAESHSATM